MAPHVFPASKEQDMGITTLLKGSIVLSNAQFNSLHYKGIKPAAGYGNFEMIML